MKCFPPKPPIARKPYISSNTISLFHNCPTPLLQNLSLPATKIKKISQLDKKRWISSNLHTDYIGSPSEHWRTIKRVRSQYQPRTQSVNLPDGTPCLKTKKALVLAQHLKDHVWNSLPLPGPIDDLIAPPNQIYRYPICHVRTLSRLPSNKNRTSTWTR